MSALVPAAQQLRRSVRRQSPSGNPGPCGASQAITRDGKACAP
jgi:hypothetical protein